MDNLALHALVNEWRAGLLPRRVQQVIQVHAAAIAFEFSGKDAGRLLLDFFDPPLCFVTHKAWSQESPSAFVGLLRKWLAGAAMRAISKSFEERIVHFDFSVFTVKEENQSMTLVAELMPRWGNLYLLDSRQAILGAFLMPRAERRNLGVGYPYLPPGKHGDISLEAFVAKKSPALSEITDAGELAKRIRGLSPIFACETLHRAHSEKRSPQEILDQMLRLIERRQTSPHLYALPANAGGFFPAPLEMRSWESQATKRCDSMNQAVEAVFEARMETTLIEAERKKIRKYLREALKKFKRIEDKLSRETRRFSADLELRRIADILLAQPTAAHSRGEKVKLVDVFHPDRPTLSVVVHPRLSLVANAQRFYEKAKRAKRGLEKINARRTGVQQTIRSLESCLQQLAAAQNFNDLEAISGLLRAEPAGPRKVSPHLGKRPAAAPAKKPEQKRKKCRVFDSADGYEILVGRNSKENDLVTTHYAQADDYWFHVADYVGSHVVLRNPRRENLEETRGFLSAAQLAAYFSQARNAPKVLIHWTQKKFVKKPKRAKPGLVTLSKFQSLLVEPQLPASSIDKPRAP